MGIEIVSVLAQNITVVYKTLNQGAIDTRRLKTLVTDSAAPAVMDMPDRLVAVWPAIPMIIELGDNRLRVTSQRAVPSIGDVPLWDYAATCDELVQPPQRVAYGFNYDVMVALQGEDAARLLIRRFAPDRPRLEQQLDGILLQFNPRLIFQREGVQYDMIMEATSAERVKVHCNVHVDDSALPAAQPMRVAYEKHFAYLAAVVPVLLQPEVK